MHSASADRLSRACTAIAAVALVALSTSDRRLLAQAAPTLTATPLTIAAGGMAAVSVANGPGNTTDWVGLYAASSRLNRRGEPQSFDTSAIHVRHSSSVRAHG